MNYELTLHVLLRLGVESRLLRVGDELAEHPLTQLSFGTFFAFSQTDAECLQLCLVERLGQTVEHVLRATALSLAHQVGILAVQHVREDLHLTPDVMIDQPLHQLAHGFCPNPVVEYPEDAAILPCTMQGALADIPKYIVIDQVGQRGHIGGQLVGQLVQGLDDESALTVAQTCQILVQLAVEIIVVLALTWYATLAFGSRLIGEHHASKSTVEELVLVEVTSRVGIGRECHAGSQYRVSRHAVFRCPQGTGTSHIIDVPDHVRKLPVSAAEAVGHLHLGQIEVLRAFKDLHHLLLEQHSLFHPIYLPF